MAVAAAAESATILDMPVLEELAMTYVLPEMGFEDQVQDRAARLISAVLEKHAPIAEVVEVEGQVNSLYDQIRSAAEGDKEAEQAVELNMLTDMVERTIKSGIVMDPVQMSVTPESKLIQHGHYLEQVQMNSLAHASRHPIMRERTKAETRNVFRKQALYEQGWFDEYSLVVFSRAERLPQEGFFEETMSCAIQLTSKNEAGLQIEPAFVAGIASPGEERHDEETTVKVGARLGIDYSGMTPTEIIDNPVLVHNSLIPNGVIDIVKMWDEAAGDTFFGEAKPQRDYQEFREECHEIVQGFKPKAQQAAKELIQAAPLLGAEVEATQQLHELSEKHMVRHAVEHKFIDPRVFGPGAQHIEMARWHQEMGNFEQAKVEERQAQHVAVSDSCPGGSRNETSDNERGDSSGDCEFISKECPICHRKNVRTIVTRKRITGECGCTKNK